jgi:shikimate kinase
MVVSLPLTEQNLILTGYIEPNRPRIGREVAQTLHMPFVDIDQRIEEAAGDRPEVIREQYGLQRLRAIEATVMEESALRRNAVMRISGSTLAYGDHYARLRTASVVVVLVARLDAILQRLHLAMGARYHDPAERALEIGALGREWEVRRLDGVHELDVTGLEEAETIERILALWRTVAIRRA